MTVFIPDNIQLGLMYGDYDTWEYTLSTFEKNLQKFDDDISNN